MKILHVTKKYPGIIGGDSTVVVNLEKYQKALGHEVSILTSNCDEINSGDVKRFGLKILPNEIDKINFKRLISLFLLFFSSFYYLSKLKPDLVNSHSPEIGFIMSLPCRICGIPLVNTCHGVTFPNKHLSFGKRKTEEFLLKYGYFKKIITVSKNSLKDFEKIRIKNVKYMPNGICLEQFAGKENSKKQELLGKNNRTIFLFVGRLEKSKGLEYLLKAAGELKKFEKNFEILLIGNGNEEQFLKQLAIKLELQNYVKFLGKKKQEEVVNYYSFSDVFILPSLYEGFPIALLEAWASGLPVITTDAAGLQSICQDKENALIVPSCDSSSMASAMLTLSKDNILREKLIKNGKKLVAERYNWATITLKIIKLYKECI